MSIAVQMFDYISNPDVIKLDSISSKRKNTHTRHTMFTKLRQASAQGASDHPLCDLDIEMFDKSVIATDSNTMFEHKTRDRAAFLEFVLEQLFLL